MTGTDLVGGRGGGIRAAGEEEAEERIDEGSGIPRERQPARGPAELGERLGE